MTLTRREVVAGLVGLGAVGLLPSCFVDQQKRKAKAKSASWLEKLPADRVDALGAFIDRLLPGSLAAGALIFVDYWLSREPMSAFQHQFDIAGVLLNRAAMRAHKKLFAACAPAEQDAIIQTTRDGGLHAKFDGKLFVERALTLVLESFFGDPKYGGNRDHAGWTFAGWHPCWWSPKRALTTPSEDLPY